MTHRENPVTNFAASHSACTAYVPGDASLDVRNVPYFVRSSSAAKRWQGYFLCTKDGFKERDVRYTRSFAEEFPDKATPIVVGCKTGGDISQAGLSLPGCRASDCLQGPS